MSNNKPLLFTKNSFYTSCCFIALANSPLGWSEETPSATTPANIDEVTVTAQMRAENLQSVAIAMSVYDKNAIANAGANSLKDMESTIPSLNFGAGGRNTRGEITIRGIGGYARNIGTDARVAVYVDGVLTGRSASFDQSLLDVEQIEVLRGPQGTLAGTNALAGAINITTQKPTDKFSAELVSDVGNYDLRSLTGKINIPLSDSLFASAILGSTKQDGFIHNITLDSDLQNVDRDTAKLKFRYVGIDNLTLDLGFDYLQDDHKATNGEALGNGSFNGFTLAPKPREVAHNTDEYEKRKLTGTTITATYLTPADFQLVSITGIRKSESSELSEEDYSPVDAAASLFDEENDQLSQELRLVSPKINNVDYVLGAYFLDQDISTHRSAITGSQFPIPHGYATTPATSEATSYSVYAHGNYRFFDAWEINGGIRYVHENKDIDFSSVNNLGSFVNVSHLRDEKTFNEVLPKLGISYHANKDTLIYGSVSRGYKSGGWNADFISTLQNFQFNPEYALNYELGIKSSFLNDRVTVDASGFVTKINDFQVFQFIATKTNTILSLTNAGKVTTQGLEVDINTRFTQHFSGNFNAAFTQAKFDEFKNGGGIGVNYDDHYLPFAPEQAYYLGLDYENMIAGQTTFYAHIDYGYTGDYFSNPDNKPINSIDSHHISNARTGLRIDNCWDISLWVKNLTDETNLRQRSTSFLNVPRGYYDPPRFYGLTLKYSVN